MTSIEAALEKGDVEAAKLYVVILVVPVASICYQGLMRDEGIDVLNVLLFLTVVFRLVILKKDVLGLHCSSQWLRLWDSWVRNRYGYGVR